MFFYAFLVSFSACRERLSDRLRADSSIVGSFAVDQVLLAADLLQSVQCCVWLLLQAAGRSRPGRAYGGSCFVHQPQSGRRDETVRTVGLDVGRKSTRLFAERILYRVDVSLEAYGVDGQPAVGRFAAFASNNCDGAEIRRWVSTSLKAKGDAAVTCLGGYERGGNIGGQAVCPIDCCRDRGSERFVVSNAGPNQRNGNDTDDGDKDPSYETSTHTGTLCAFTVE